jgi:hypothetical protein
MYQNNWEIVDENGTIYSGSEDEMRELFNAIVHGVVNDNLDEDLDWLGDLRLIQVHAIHR